MKQKGFAPIIILILLVLVAGGVYYFGTKNKVASVTPVVSTQPSSSPAESFTADPTTDWQTYNSPKNIYSIKYPNNWYMYQYGFEGIAADVRFGNTPDLMKLPNRNYYDLTLLYTEGEISHPVGLKYFPGAEPYKLNGYEGNIFLSNTDQGTKDTRIELQGPGGFVTISYWWEDPVILNQILSTFRFNK